MMALLDKKWSLIILARIKDGPLQHQELRQAISELTDEALSIELRDLIDSGFVEKADKAGSSRYSLSVLGQSLVPLIEALHTFGTTTAKEVRVTFETS